MKNQINKELEHMQFNINMEMLEKKKSSVRRNKAVLILICVFLVGTTVNAGAAIYNHFIKLNKEVLPELDEMTIVNTNDLFDVENGEYLEHKQYVSYDVLQEELGVDLLYSNLADDNSSMIITRKTDNENWNIISITAFIVGDVRDLKKVSGQNLYTWTEGDTFYSPIDMTIRIISSEEQLIIGWDKEYLGSYELVENYKTRDGVKVNILASGKDDLDRKVYHAIFVVDGIQYTLKGKVDLAFFKEIIESFYYH